MTLRYTTIAVLLIGCGFLADGRMKEASLIFLLALFLAFFAE